MLIGFIGCPCSGKTTTAAMTFADLKANGNAAEFITEQARFYIASIRALKRLQPSDPVILTDEDQVRIITQQEHAEETLRAACDSATIIVADSSIFNTLLYLSPERRKQADIRACVQRALGRYDLIFYCGPVKPPLTLDSNRVHNEEQSLEIDKAVPGIMREHAPSLKMIPLFGAADQRHRMVTKTIILNQTTAWRSP